VWLQCAKVYFEIKLSGSKNLEGPTLQHLLNLKSFIHVRESIKIKMTNLIGALIGIILILFLLSPIILTVYMLINSKIDIDGDGKDDLPNRWQT
jgi:hypothetical protein